LDGPIHDYQQEKDYNRDLVLKELGLKVIRIRNEELKDIRKVKDKILKSLNILSPASPSLRERGG
jgi:very-short-patch-repair endonuclease